MGFSLVLGRLNKIEEVIYYIMLEGNLVMREVFLFDKGFNFKIRD